jgi:hypothetical protein
LHPEPHRILHGLAAVGVEVAQIHPDAEGRGLSRTALREDIVEKLQHAGLQVLTEEEWKTAPEQPLLTLTLGVDSLDSLPVYSVFIKLQLWQNAFLTRKLVICEPVITWEEARSLRTVSVSQLAGIQQEVYAAVDRFLDAYRAENLKR